MKKEFWFLAFWLVVFVVIVGAAITMITTGQPKPLRPDAVGLSVIVKDMGVK